MPRSYPPAFSSQGSGSDRRFGRSVAEIAADLGLIAQAIFAWRRQESCRSGRAGRVDETAKLSRRLAGRRFLFENAPHGPRMGSLMGVGRMRVVGLKGAFLIGVGVLVAFSGPVAEGLSSPSPKRLDVKAAAALKADIVAVLGPSYTETPPSNGGIPSGQVFPLVPDASNGAVRSLGYNYMASTPPVQVGGGFTVGGTSQASVSVEEFPTSARAMTVLRAIVKQFKLPPNPGKATTTRLGNLGFIEAGVTQNNGAGQPSTTTAPTLLFVEGQYQVQVNMYLTNGSPDQNLLLSLAKAVDKGLGGKG